MGVGSARIGGNDLRGGYRVLLGMTERVGKEQGMIDLEKAQKVVDMITSEIMPEYAYTSFEAKCKDYGITPEDFNNFLNTALELIKKANDGN